LSYLETNLEELIGVGAITDREAALVREARLPDGYRIEPQTDRPDAYDLIFDSGGCEIRFYGSDPVDAAEKRIATIGEQHETLFLIGAGLGHELEAALRTRPRLMEIAVVENEPALLRAALERIDLSATPRIKWHIWLGDVSEENITRIIEFEMNLGDKPLATISNPAFLKSNGPFYERFSHAMKMYDHLDDMQRLLEKMRDEDYAPVHPMYILQRLHELDMPKKVRVEPTNFCNLRCTICPSPGYTNGMKGFMDIALYARVLDELRRIDRNQKYYLILYLGGEPLMHKDIAEMVGMAAKMGFETHLNTNSMLLDDDMSERLIRAGLTRIHFSFDDFTPEQHEKIRIGSDRDTAYRNILRFIETRRRLGSETPTQIIAALKIPPESRTDTRADEPVMSDEFRKLFIGLPVTVLLIWAHHWASDFTAEAEGMAPRARLADYYPCHLLWNEMSIRWDGTVVPCCYDLRGEQPVGKFPDDGLLEIWNGRELMALRQSHIGGRAGRIPLCRGCSALRDTSFMDEFFGDAAHIYKKSCC